MYDELVKRLRSQCQGYGKECEDCNADGNCRSQMENEAADAIDELTRENESLAKSVNEASKILRRRWIPVTERLPEDRVPVLATYIGFCTGEKSSDLLAVRFEGMWCYWDGDPCSYDKCNVEITHWMPIPEPPKEET